MLTDLRYIILLPASAMSDLAKELRALAEKIEIEARNKQQAQATRERVRKHRADRRHLVKQIAMDLAHGRPVDLTDEKKARLVDQARKVAGRVKLDIRNAQIMQLRRQGFTDPEIADRVNMHPKSVSRIIREQLGRRSLPQSTEKQRSIRHQ